MRNKTAIPLAVSLSLSLFAATPALAQASSASPSQYVASACATTAAAPDLVLHVEVQDEYGPYSAGETVMVAEMSGLPIVTLHCDGPWANFQLKPGRYRVMAFLYEQISNEVMVDVPANGTSITLKLQPPPMPPLEPEVADDGTIRLPPPPTEAADLSADNPVRPSP